MGLGDCLLASGEAHLLYKKFKQPVLIVAAHGRVVWNDVWNGIPYILKQTRAGLKYQTLVSGGGVRPYIARKTAARWIWQNYKPTPAEVFFTDAELKQGERGKGFVIIEPHGKSKPEAINKQWGKWHELVERNPSIPWAQVGPSGTEILPGVVHIETATFRQAGAVLASSLAAVLPEGGLSHLAAAVGTPSVVIYGGFISPDQTGYDLHRNIFTGGEPCGMRSPCSHCRKAMGKITVDMVMENLRGLLND